MIEKSFSDIWWLLIVFALVSYFIGSVNFSIIISRSKGRDIRNIGSGNPGMMNMSRNFGLKTGVAILLLDMVKGGLPTLVGYLAFKNFLLENTTFVLSDMTEYLCGFFAVLGHIFPFYLKFKGGKGIAATIGVFVVANPIYGIISGLCGLAFILITSMGSMGSLIAVTPPAIAAEIHFYVTYIYNDSEGFMPPSSNDMMIAILLSIFFVLGICCLTWVAHYANIERLITGDEHVTSWSQMIKNYKKKLKQKRAEKKEEAKANAGSGETANISASGSANLNEDGSETGIETSAIVSGEGKFADTGKSEDNGSGEKKDSGEDNDL